VRVRVYAWSVVVLALTVALAAGGGAATAAGSPCPSSNRPNELVLVGGSGQTAQLGKAFQTNLQVQLANTNGCPLTGNLAGVNVDFVAPGGGASGIFASSGSNRVTVGTNAEGIAVAPAFVANHTAGSYGVYAESDYGTVRLDLTNTASGLPASIAANSATSQEATVNSQYAQQLQARVLDANGNPVQGATVSFSVVTGPTGAGAGFLGGGQATATTDSNGVATSPPLLANAVPGRFTAAASTEGVSGVAIFNLDNHASATTILASATVDPPARTAVNTRYGRPLSARVLDASGQPIEGASVTFAIAQAANGASAAFVGGTTQASALTGADGQATSPPLVANKTAGTFAATAAVAGAADPLSFTLQNLAAAPHTVTAGAATGESTTVGSRFPVRLAVTVVDESGNPVAGAVVSFTAPAHGPSGTFILGSRKHSRVARVRTDADGVAVAPVLSANRKRGGYAVTAVVGAGGKRVAFALVNRPRT
jgi:protocatechuate 3,4-dioxygenase beta subunit